MVESSTLDGRGQSDIGQITKRQPADRTLDTLALLAKKVAKLEKTLLSLDTEETDNVEIKTTTGNPSDSWEGRRVINTFDNAYKIYADGSFRTIVAW